MLVLVRCAAVETELTADIENSVNSPDRRELRRLLSKLRLFVALRRCEKSVSSALIVQPPPPLVLDDDDDDTGGGGGGHPLAALGKHKLFVRVPKDSRHFLVGFQRRLVLCLFWLVGREGGGDLSASVQCSVSNHCVLTHNSCFKQS